MVTVARAALCLCMCLFVSEVRGAHIPQWMNKTIHNLRQHYKIPKNQFGKPIFSKDLLDGKPEMRKVYLGGVLETYEKLLGQMLSQHLTASPAPQTSVSGITTSQNAATSKGCGEGIRAELGCLLKKVQELKKAHYKEYPELLNGLQNLQLIQVDNRMVQSKALFELTRLFEEASELSDPLRMKKRRRRHLRGSNLRRG